MIDYKKLARLCLTAAGVFFLGSQAVASDLDKVPFDTEVKSCVAEIADHANYEDAKLVQHTVFEIKRRVNGYVLAIDTSVYTDEDGVAAREYASVCTARGDGKPVRFRISETGSGA
jgi:hypothetical protein